MWVYVVFGLNRDQSTMWNDTLSTKEDVLKIVSKFGGVLSVFLFIMPAPDQTGRQRHCVVYLYVGASVRPSISSSPDQTGRQRHCVVYLYVGASVRPSISSFICASVAKLVNSIRWFENDSTDLMQIGPSGPRVTAWIAQLCGSVGQRSKSRDTKITNKSPFGETSQELSDKS